MQEMVCAKFGAILRSLLAVMRKRGIHEIRTLANLSDDEIEVSKSDIQVEQTVVIRDINSVAAHSPNPHLSVTAFFSTLPTFITSSIAW
jgi:hypothetical protein